MRSCNGTSRHRRPPQRQPEIQVPSASAWSRWKRAHGNFHVLIKDLQWYSPPSLPRLSRHPVDPWIELTGQTHNPGLRVQQVAGTHERSGATRTMLLSRGKIAALHFNRRTRDSATVASLSLLWQIYSSCMFAHIHLWQCGHRFGGIRAMSATMA